MFNFIAEGPLHSNELPKSYWCSEGIYNLYCRRTTIVFQGIRCSAFVIANIECSPEHRGKKQFKDLLPRIEEAVLSNGYSCLLFESVLNNRFKNFLYKNGYTVDRESILCNMVKLFEQESHCIAINSVI